MGDAGTGKTALVSQFMTSEYMHTYDASLGESPRVHLLRESISDLSATEIASRFSDDEFGEKTVSILLDGEESEMIFIDHPSSEMSVSISAKSQNRNDEEERG